MKYQKIFLLWATAMFAAVNVATAAPINGGALQFRQPDGSLVPVVVWGDEFYRDVESPDGYTLVHDDSGWICYAKLSEDGGEYVSTGVRYTGSDSNAPEQPKKLRINKKSLAEKYRKAREAAGYGNAAGYFAHKQRKARTASGSGRQSGISHAPPEAGPEKIVGLTILIDFPNDATTATWEQINDMLNTPGGINGTAIPGSVYDYFHDVSNGKLEYTNVVTPFVTASENSSYYDSGWRLRALLEDVVGKLQASDFDFSGVTKRDDGAIAVLNVLFVGHWGQAGLWAHANNFGMMGTSPYLINGIAFGSYQITPLGKNITDLHESFGTIVHENGHSLMGWPDLYSTDGGAQGVSNECVMAFHDRENPQMPNPYFRYLAGWIDVTDIAGVYDDFTHTSNSHSAYRYERSNYESYYIEARRRTGRSAKIPHDGLLIWHIHTEGINYDFYGVVQFPMVKVVGTLYGHGMTFNRPAAKYHDGSLSAINISQISMPGNVMSFTTGPMPPLAPETYTVTFDPMGGTASAPSFIGVPAGGKIAAPSNVIKIGYTFGGWHTESSCETPWDFDVNTVASDITLYAKWTQNNMHVGDIEWYTSKRYRYYYTIGTAAELAGLAYLVNSGVSDFAGRNITLGAHIDLSADYGETFNGGKGWVPIGTSSAAAFKGTFYGGDRIIRGLYINDPQMANAGLFGYIANANLKHIGVENMNITGGGNVGGIAGYAANADVFSCYTTGAAAGGGLTGSAGGVVGTLDNSAMTSSYSTASVGHGGSGSSAGGLAGAMLAGSVITNSAALNRSVAAGLAGSAGRVVGVIEDGAAVSGNIAFDGMIGTFAADAVNNGADISLADINADGTLNNLFTNAGNFLYDYHPLVWTTLNGRLPGLFGNTVEMPTHLSLHVSAVTNDRVIPNIVITEDAAVITPISVTAFELTVGPNPVSKSDGVVNVFVIGKRVDKGELTVYDATGNVVKKINIRDNAILGNTGRRVVGSWNLKDGKGRLVPPGSYLVRGVVKTIDGKREKVSVIVGVR